MPLFPDTKRDSYRAQRAASNGASVTLVSKCGHYEATNDCAKRISTIIGSRELNTIEGVPILRIPLAEMQAACEKLSSRFSVALIDVDLDPQGFSRYVLVWRIAAQSAEPIPEPPTLFNLDEF